MKRLRNAEIGRVALLAAAIAMGGMAIAGGCAELFALFGPPIVTVQLKNSGDFDMNVVLYLSSNPNATREELISSGERIEQIITPGQTFPVQRNCDLIKSMVISPATLRVIANNGPQVNSDVLRDPTNYDCFDVVTFTFTNGPAGTSLAVTPNTQKRP